MATVIEIFIFSMHDFDLILILKIRQKVWICRIRAMYSIASLHTVYMTRKISSKDV